MDHEPRTHRQTRPPELRGPAPREMYPWLRRASVLESAIFAGLVAVWIAPGAEGATTLFGWAHGVGYLALLFGIFAGVLRHEVPFWLLAATFTPLGPIGSLAGFAFLDKRIKASSRLAGQYGVDTRVADV